MPSFGALDSDSYLTAEERAKGEKIVGSQLNQPLTMLCPYKEANKYTWLKNTEIISDNDRLFIDTDDGSIKIIQVQKQDEGKWVCEAKNQAGTASFSHIVDIQEPAKVLSSGENLNVTAGMTVDLNCQASGNPPPEIKWLFKSAISDTADFIDLKDPPPIRVVESSANLLGRQLKS